MRVDVISVELADCIANVTKEKNMNKNNQSRGAVYPLGCIQIVLIILKMFKLITISWVQVFIPTYITFGLGLILAICYILIFAERKI